MSYKINTNLEFEIEDKATYDFISSLITNKSLGGVVKTYLEKLVKGYTIVNLNSIIETVIPYLESQEFEETEGTTEKLTSSNELSIDAIKNVIENLLDEKLKCISTNSVMKVSEPVVKVNTSTVATPATNIAPSTKSTKDFEDESWDDDDFDFDDDEDENPTAHLSLASIKSINKKLSGGGE